ncbi:dUTP diphosphatase, partial [candidate division KSB1 bacterium]|nr:dUTP diphosphatase [candidate division KSB1 bacterium]
FWLVPRSGFSSKYLMGIRNVPGLVDFEYRGEVFISAIAFGHAIPVARGERIAQLVPVLQTNVEIKFVQALSQSRRGSGGFGSTGQ